MGGQVYLFCLALADMSVHLGCRQLGMTEQLLNDPQVGTAVKKVGGKSMPENVGMDSFSDTGFLGAFIQNLLYSACWQTPAILVEENGVCLLSAQ